MKKYWYLFIILFVIIILITYIIIKGDDKMQALNITSSAFENGGNIPVKYTGKGEDVSIPLEIGNVVSSGKSIAIIMDDPDAPSGTFTHWLIWNIPASTNQIQEGTSKNKELLNGAVEGKSGFGTVGYMGPNPPSGTHTYRIKVYVLDKLLDLKEGSSKVNLEDAMKGHILQYGLLEGKFSHN